MRNVIMAVLAVVMLVMVGCGSDDVKVQPITPAWIEHSETIKSISSVVGDERGDTLIVTNDSKYIVTYSNDKAISVGESINVKKFEPSEFKLVMIEYPVIYLAIVAE